ncbi:SPFH domain-containing protein [Flammeovirga pacifica]|uniref:Band 7 domain-containing protein n=1 Tax=Flammeovirga pacifica TaxID=915059 RepID=A0A1S1Z3L4_FLAPC|nr:SPFH domain-containing protein [Flammeovirga pacifica]OHX67817.1 hypothetical protein NH26_16465 [Flammeovirga pacifica]
MKDKVLKGFSGYFMIILQAILFGLAGYVLSLPNLGAVSMLILFIDLVLLRGYFTVSSNEAALINLLGKYKGTINKAGFYWSHPFRKIIKVNLKDNVQHIGPWSTFAKDGAELELNVECRWQIKDAAKAYYEMSNINETVNSIAKEKAQTLVEMYPYENTNGVSLRLHSNEINSALMSSLKVQLAEYGILLQSVRFNSIRLIKKKRSPEDALQLAKKLVHEVNDLEQLSENEKSEMQLQLLSILMTE